MPSTETNRPEPAVEGPVERTWTSVGFAFEGRTPTRVCRGSQQIQCVVAKHGVNTTVELPALSTPVFMQGVLTWNSATPTNGHLIVDVMVHNGKNYVYSQGYWSGTRGESPLSVSFDLSRYAGHKLALSVRTDECMLDTAMAANCALAGAAFGVKVDPAQEFAFDGDLLGWADGNDA